MKKFDIKFIAKSAILAALYAALTWVFTPISYGSIQFRISEILVLLVVLNPKYAYALILGCFIANTTSSLGWYDMVFGTLATTLAIIPMCLYRKMHIAAFWPVLSNAIIVSIELGFAFDLWGSAFLYDMATVGFGELVVLYLLGIPVMSAICKNEYIVEMMNLDKSKAIDLKIDISKIVYLILGVLGLILFVAYPMYKVTIDDEETTYSMFKLLIDGDYYLISALLISVAYICVGFFTKNKVRLILLICLGLSLFAPYIIVGATSSLARKYVYYYLYIIFALALVIAPIILYIRSMKNIEAIDLEKDQTFED